MCHILNREGVKLHGSTSSLNVFGASGGHSHGNQEPGSTKKEKDDKKGSKKRLCWIYAVLSSVAFFGGDNLDDDEDDDDEGERHGNYDDEMRMINWPGGIMICCDVLQLLIRRFLLMHVPFPLLTFHC